MAKLKHVAPVRAFKVVLTTMLLILISTSVWSQSADIVTTYKDENGWKLQVNGKDFFVKGVVWGYAPPGTNYSYSIWNQSEDIIKQVVDKEFSLMRAANINAIRTFAIIPPKWVEYIYQKYSIMTVINPLMGRYGATIDGVWKPVTDYSDTRTREVLKADVLKEVEKYKNVPGVLMFALGNESNYGLEWSSSFEIENLPVGEQQREKAKFLYSLFEEVIAAGKQIDPNHPFTIVNGDIQYLDLISEHGQDWDMLGINVYRGIGFTDLWSRVKNELDLPVIFFEFGSDAFNARDFAEDQAAQANYLRLQWQEIYNKSYGNGEEGNALGGFVFEWRDEWWKYKQTENLDVQDRTASWANGGYKFDFVEGQNNMNEEWFGINRIGDVEDGVYVSEPRMAYDVLRAIWALDPYVQTKANVNDQIREMNMDYYSLKSEVRALKSAQKTADKFRISGGSFKAEYLAKGNDQDIDEDEEDGLTFSDGQMAFIDFEFQPTSKIKGNFSINILGNVADSDFEFRYGDRGKPITVEILEDGEFGVVRTTETLDDRERIEIYDFQASYTNENFDLLAFYHVPRYHWMHEGDFYGLLRETTDMDGPNGQDIWNAKAPYGVEYIGKQSLDGLKIVLGPEIYWGANPSAIVKYEFATDNVEYAIMHHEDIAERDDSASATEATERETRQTTIYAKSEIFNGVTLELGGIMASTEKIDEKYDRIDDGDVVVDEIEFEDTLGAKAKLTFDVTSSTEAYLGLNYAGLVADGGDTLKEWGTELPYSEYGNKWEVEGGIRFTAGDYTIYPRFLYRENLEDANPLIEPEITGTTLSPGIDPRNRDDDPFAVLDNREATAGEIYLTYDPTPETYFYDWDVDMKEDALLAYNLGLTVTRYDTATDAYLFYFEEGERNASFGEGLDAEDVWLLKSKLVYNPNPGLRLIGNLEAGKQQTTGRPNEDAVEFYGLDGKVIVNKKHIYSGYIKIDDYGPYDFQRQFNLIYPLQAKLEYTRLLDQLFDQKISSQVGIKGLYRTLDENSPEEEYLDGENDYMFEIQTYIEFKF